MSLSTEPLAVSRHGLSVTHLHRDGQHAVRVLMVADPCDALDGGSVWRFVDEVVDRLWLRLRRGLDVDVVEEPRAVLHAIAGSFTSWPRIPYDLVVFVIDPPEALGSRSGRGLIAILQSVLLHLVATTQVVLIVREPTRTSVKHRRAFELGAALTDAARSSSVRLTVMRTAGGRGSSADAVAEQLQAAVAGRAPTAAEPPIGEDGAVGGLRGLTGRLDRIVEQARSAFDADVAAVNLAEHGTLTTIACDGGEAGEQPLPGSLCDLTIGHEGLVVVADTFAVPALWSYRAVQAARPIRFYAGFPIGAPGRPAIGALCVYDRAPRRRGDLDFTLLSDLAMLAEGELVAAGVC